MTDADTSPAPRERMLDAIGGLWWLFLVRGIFLLILGGYALFRPDMTIAVLAQVIGIFVIAEGIIAIIAGILGRSSRLWTIARGILAILVGAFVFAQPIVVAGVTTAVIMYLLGATAIVVGVLEIVAAIQDRKQIEGEGWLILGGALTVVLGIILLIAPLSFGMLIVRILGAYAIISSVSLIVFAFRVRKLKT